ncbi:glycosyltransferase [Algoriphagus jejuensis]|uniref:Glycosyltransferase n=1 Tax=Algoriphagus jejuensis TaxID=419934 RepID=A0ABN1N3R6_9BACT
MLIPLRNEAENIEALFIEIRKLDYPALDILLIDDQSEDRTFGLLEEKARLDSRMKVLKSLGSGKKTALQLGVEQARTELILCSDADCGFSEHWLKKMLAPFADPRVQLVCGPVISAEQSTFFQRFQQIEWASILLMTQYFFAVKKPLMCSGANLAYRKSAFQKVNGYDQNFHYLSGDDEFLLKKILRKFGAESCVYLPFAESLVLTKPQAKVSEMINQRVRWAGKWRVHRDRMHAWSAVLPVLAQVIWGGSVMLMGLGQLGVLMFLAVWLGKISAEGIALGRVLRALGFHRSGFDFVLTSLAHTLYVLTVAVGALRGNFLWKGRSN